MADITWEVRKADAVDNYVHTDADGVETTLNGVVTNVYLKCSVSNATDSETLHNYLVRLDEPDVDSFSPLADVLEADVLQWALDKIPADSKSLVEQNLTNLLQGATSVNTVFNS
jgi:hypothetical protein